MLGIGVLAFVGATRSAAIVPVYTDPVESATIMPSKLDPPSVADRVPVNQGFVVAWRFANIGSCETWTGVKLVRLNDAVPGPASSYSVGSPANDATLPSALAGLGSVQATVALTAPTQAGVYVTEWQLQLADHQPFGPVMVRQIQVYEADKLPEGPAGNPRNQICLACCDNWYHRYFTRCPRCWQWPLSCGAPSNL